MPLRLDQPRVPSLLADVEEALAELTGDEAGPLRAWLAAGELDAAAWAEGAWARHAALVEAQSAKLVALGRTAALRKAARERAADGRRWVQELRAVLDARARADDGAAAVLREELGLDTRARARPRAIATQLRALVAERERIGVVVGEDPHRVLPRGDDLLAELDALDVQVRAAAARQRAATRTTRAAIGRLVADVEAMLDARELASTRTGKALHGFELRRLRADTVRRDPGGRKKRSTPRPTAAQGPVASVAV